MNWKGRCRRIDKMGESHKKIVDTWCEYKENIEKEASVNFGWDYANNVLYNICKEMNEELKPSEMAGRMILIGRTYAATLERNNCKNASSTDELYFNIINENNKVKWNELINKLNNFDSLEECDNIVLEIHKMLVDILNEIVHVNKTSLASKFLHFHKPNYFYIYDSRAKEAVSSLIDEKIYKREISNQCDIEYARFYKKVIKLKEIIEEYEKNDNEIVVSPREMDDFLLYVYNKF